jgi:hypothetical protein
MSPLKMVILFHHHHTTDFMDSTPGAAWGDTPVFVLGGEIHTKVGICSYYDTFE